MALLITLNGQARDLALDPGSTLHDLISVLGLKPDQVALEQNGRIVRRTAWIATPLASGDRIEVVQFVGGGSTPSAR